MDLISVYVPILGSFSKILTITQQDEDEMKNIEDKQETGTKLIYKHLQKQWSGPTAKNCPRMVHKISQTLIKTILNSLQQKSLKFLQKSIQKHYFSQEIDQL